MLTKSQKRLQGLLTKFLPSRRQGLSPHTIAFYQTCLKPLVNGYELTPDGINQFLGSLRCNNGGKFAYFRAIRVFVNWLIRNDYLKDNPIKRVDAPKPREPILPNLSTEQVQYLIEKACNLRDKRIISLLAESGMRLNEMANIKPCDIDWFSLLLRFGGRTKNKGEHYSLLLKVFSEWNNYVFMLKDAPIFVQY